MFAGVIIRVLVRFLAHRSAFVVLEEKIKSPREGKVCSHDC